MKTILFLCTGNSCRSQMAEGFAKEIYGEEAKILSAGIEKHGLNPFAVEAMKNLGVDISSQQSQSLEDFTQDELEQVDIVLTVCGHAHETCPVFPGDAKVVHHGFPDPPRLAEEYPEEEKLTPYLEVAKKIREFLHNRPL